MNRMPNQQMHTNRRPASQFRRAGLFELRLRSQRTFTAAVGDLERSATKFDMIDAILQSRKVVLCRWTN